MMISKYVFFIRLDNLVYKNNPFITISSNTIGQQSTQYTTVNKKNKKGYIVKYISRFINHNRHSFHQPKQ